MNLKFRFHTGSIKRNLKHAYLKDAYLSFDSILVRLKVLSHAEHHEISVQFRFHTGSIKR